MENAQRKADDLLSTKYKDNGATITELIRLQNRITEIYNEGRDAKRILQNLVFTKASRLLDGVYILIRSNLGQESGALLRPAIEGIELLEYIRKIPEGYEQALNEKLPPPGKRAEKIDGQFKTLREYLNEDASHFSISHSAMINLIDSINGGVKCDDDIEEAVFHTNLKMISLFLQFLTYQGILIDENIMSRHQDVIGVFNRLRADVGRHYGLN